MYFIIVLTVLANGGACAFLLSTLGLQAEAAERLPSPRCWPPQAVGGGMLGQHAVMACMRHSVEPHVHRLDRVLFIARRNPHSAPRQSR